MKKFLSVILAVLLIISVIPTGLLTINVSAATSGTTGECTWTLDGTVLTIGGNGTMENYTSSSPAPWGLSITSVVIENGVTSIGSFAFYNCTGLTNITIPNSVTSIGNFAFRNCTSITDITIPNSVTSIADGALRGCTKLESIMLPFIGASRTSTGSSSSVFGHIFGSTVYGGSDTVKQYYNSSQSYYYYIPSSIKSVTITDATSISFGAFYNCSNITSIIIPNSVTSIDSKAFYNCDGLTSITIPNSVTSIGNYAFDDCTSITKVTIGNSVKSIGNSAFRNCTNLTNITIPNSVTSIRDYAFSSCSNLTNVYYAGLESHKNNISIGYDCVDLRNATWHYNSCVGSANHTYDNLCDKKCDVCDFTRDVNHLYGDDNICDYCNDEVDSKDLTFLRRYLPDWDVANFDEDYADINGDGEVNSKDATYLARYLADWDGYTLD